MISHVISHFFQGKVNTSLVSLYSTIHRVGGNTRKRTFIKVAVQDLGD